MSGPADAVAVLNATGPAVALWRERAAPGRNRPPVPVGTLPPLTLGVDDGAVSLDVGGAFRDPDGDELTFRAASSAPAVAEVTVLGSTLTVTPVAQGAATVTVTATDARGADATAAQTFAVTVTPPPNRPPVPVGNLPPLTLGVDDGAVSLELGGAFNDPDGDTLTFRAASSATRGRGGCRARQHPDRDAGRPGSGDRHRLRHRRPRRRCHRRPDLCGDRDAAPQPAAGPRRNPAATDAEASTTGP